MKSGKFISLEGGEGVGKTTNLQFIRQQLEQKGVSVLITREPGGTLLAEKIRSLLIENSQEKISDLTELLLIFAARCQHINEVIKPALDSGQWVLTDRFADATFAYQGGGRGLNNGIISWLEQTVQKDILPDLTLLFDAPVMIGMQRARARAELDRFELEQMDFFERVRHSYLKRAQQFPERIHIIDANQPLDEVQSHIKKKLADFLHEV